MNRNNPLRRAEAYAKAAAATLQNTTVHDVDTLEDIKFDLETAVELVTKQLDALILEQEEGR